VAPHFFAHLTHDLLNWSESSAAQVFDDPSDRFAGVALIAHLGCDFLLSGFRAESGGFADRPGEWFFTINARAGFKRADGGSVVVVVGATDPDGVQVVVFVK
jgi:hypothetical protein